MDEVIKIDELEILVNDSGLEETKANYLLENFKNYFEIAADWEKKAKGIVVTDESQKAEMAMARTGRLFLREKRIAIEKSRKELKEQSLREGKAIDGIANVLKALIEPIEEHLEKQEHFVENKQKAEAAQKLLEEQVKVEAERLAKEKADREEQERIRIENQKLKEEADKREAEMKLEREKAEAEKNALETKVKQEKEAAEKVLRAAQEKALEEKRALEAKATQEREVAEQARKIAEKKADDEKQALLKKQEKLQEELKAQIECPSCHHKFNLK